MAEQSHGQAEADDGVFVPLGFDLPGGTVEMRYYRTEQPVGAVAYVGGAGGGWDTPALGLYPRLALRLVDHRIAGLRVRFRRATDLHSCVEDLRQGVEFLHAQGLDSLGLVGHSLGGAVVIGVAATSPEVRTVVALAPQSFGAEGVAQLAPRCSILFVHGLLDQVLPPATSLLLYNRASEPKGLELLPDTGHLLDESADRVYDVVHDWLLKRLEAPV